VGEESFFMLLGQKYKDGKKTFSQAGRVYGPFYSVEERNLAITTVANRRKEKDERFLCFFGEIVDPQSLSVSQQELASA
jgi:hypothetical protein